MPTAKELQEIAAKARAAKLAREAQGILPATPAVISTQQVEKKVEEATTAVIATTVAAVVEESKEVIEPVNDQHRKILESLSTLKSMLIAEDPTFPNLLQEIHDHLFQYPELNHILTDEQMDAVYQGLLKESNTHIVVSASKKSTPKSVNKKLTGMMPTGQNVGDLL